VLAQAEIVDEWWSRSRPPPIWWAARRAGPGRLGTAAARCGSGTCRSSAGRSCSSGRADLALRRRALRARDMDRAAPGDPSAPGAERTSPVRDLPSRRRRWLVGRPGGPVLRDRLALRLGSGRRPRSAVDQRPGRHRWRVLVGRGRDPVPVSHPEPGDGLRDRLGRSRPSSAPRRGHRPVRQGRHRLARGPAPRVAPPHQRGGDRRVPGLRHRHRRLPRRRTGPRQVPRRAPRQPGRRRRTAPHPARDPRTSRSQGRPALWDPPAAARRRREPRRTRLGPTPARPRRW